jgi:predicted Na+-dependent transporter
VSWAKRALSGYLSDSAGTLVLTILGFVLVPVILGKIDQQVYGYWLF